MANPYYNHGSVPPQGSFGASPPMRGEFDLVAAGFALLPTLSGNANTVIQVNGLATALVANVQEVLAVGSVSAPAYAFVGHTSSGLFYDTNNRVAMAVNGLNFVTFDSGATQFPGVVLSSGAFIGTGGGGLQQFQLGSNEPWIGLGTNGQINNVSNNLSHVKELAVFSQSAGAFNFAAVQINPTFNYAGAQTGKSYALGVAVVNTNLNGSVQKLLSVGTTTTDLYTGYTPKVEIDNAGNITTVGLLDLSSATAGQVKFPASQNASADANTLDDYKESTFTPVLNFGGATTGITYGTQLGHYTKVGNLVTFTINLVLTSKGSATGAATITGMPATSTNTSGYRAAFSIYFTAGATLTTNMLMVTIPANSTTLSLFDLAAAAASALDNTDFTNTSEVTITGSYRV